MSYNGLEKIGIWGMVSAGKISFINNKTGVEDLYIDYANSLSISYDYSDINARGRNSDMVTWRSAISATGELGLEISSLEQMALSSGATIKEDKVVFYNRMQIVATKDEDTITLKEEPIKDSVKAYVFLNDNVTKDTSRAITIEGNGGARAFKLKGSKKGDIIVITYETEKNAKNFALSSVEKESASYTMIIHADGKTHVEGSLVPLQIKFGNVKLNPTTETALDAENPVSFTISLKILADSKGDICTWSYVPDVEETTAPTTTTTTETA